MGKWRESYGIFLGAFFLFFISCNEIIFVGYMGLGGYFGVLYFLIMGFLGYKRMVIIFFFIRDLYKI